MGCRIIVFYTRPVPTVCVRTLLALADHWIFQLQTSGIVWTVNKEIWYFIIVSQQLSFKFWAWNWSKNQNWSHKFFPIRRRKQSYLRHLVSFVFAYLEFAWRLARKRHCFHNQRIFFAEVVSCYVKPPSKDN